MDQGTSRETWVGTWGVRKATSDPSYGNHYSFDRDNLFNRLKPSGYYMYRKV
jgi:hypothetical protein